MSDPAVRLICGAGVGLSAASAIRLAQNDDIVGVVIAAITGALLAWVALFVEVK